MRVYVVFSTLLSRRLTKQMRSRGSTLQISSQMTEKQKHKIYSERYFWLDCKACFQMPNSHSELDVMSRLRQY